MKPLSIFIIVLLWPFIVSSQVVPMARLTGRVLDEATHRPIEGASVSLILTKDSSRTKYASITNEDGHYQIGDVGPGSYRIYVSFIGYHPVLGETQLKVSSDAIQLPEIYLKKKLQELAVVEVTKSRPPLTIKKDTLTYNAAAFKTNPHDNLEQLMQKIPGIEVMPDGTLKVNGVLVKTVLLDGHAYFGDDTKLASKYLLAGLVDRIQVIDREPEIANDNSSRTVKSEKVVNLVIKKSHYDEWNGAVSGAFGTEQHYSSKLSLNHFKAGRQISIIGAANNVNGFDQQLEPAGSNGLSRYWNAGVNFNQVISPRLSLESSYALSANVISLYSESLRRNTLPDSGYTSRQNMRSSQRLHNQLIVLNLSYQLDSTARLVFRNQFAYGMSDIMQGSDYESRSERGYLMNAGTSSSNEESNDYRYGSQLLFTKRFKKDGQILNAGLDFGLIGSITEPFNHADTRYAGTGGQPGADSFSLFNRQKTAGGDLLLRIKYTRPIGRNQFLDFTYLYSEHITRNIKKVYNFDPVGQHFDLPNDSLSATLQGRYHIHNGGIGYRKQKERLDYSFGVNLFLNDQDTKIINLSQPVKQHLVTGLPYLVFNYNFDATRRLHFDYSSNVLPPSATQLLPVPDYGNPLLIRMGNTDLRPARTQDLNLEFRFIDPVTSRSFLASLSTGFQKDKIVDDMTMDSIGRQIIKPVNVDGPFQGTLMISNVLPVSKLHSFLQINTLFSLSREISLNNGLMVHTRRLMAIQSVGFNYTHKQAWDILFLGNIIYNGTAYEELSQSALNTVDVNLSLKANVYLPLGVRLGTKASYNLNRGREAGYNTDQLIVNLLAAKELFGKKADLQLMIYDLMGRSNAITRNVGDSYVEDIRTNPLTRMGMLSFTYYFGKPGTH